MAITKTVCTVDACAAVVTMMAAVVTAIVLNIQIPHAGEIMVNIN
jgi:hypothetical protein